MLGGTISTGKGIIQSYWTKNAPGLDIISRRYSREQTEFYLEGDKLRYRYDSYIPPLLQSFSEKGKRILEVGCGLGSDSRLIACSGANLTFLDLSSNNVALTRKGMRLLNLSASGICADAESLPFKDESFDIVYSFGVLHHTNDTVRAIREAYRVLKPNGSCVVMLYHKGYSYCLLILLYGWRRLLGNWSWERLMSKYDHTPLSKLYSEKEIRGLFSIFSDVDIEIATYGGIQAHPLLRYVHMALSKSKLLMRHFGSFAMIRAKK